MTDLAVSSEGLTKRFRSGQVAVNAVDLAVPCGGVDGISPDGCRRRPLRSPRAPAPVPHLPAALLSGAVSF